METSSLYGGTFSVVTDLKDIVAHRSAKPLASVLMVTYNHASYIRKAVNSVLSQKTQFPFELVIGEDCSTDGTREIVMAYAQQYPDIVRLVTSGQNVGSHKNGLRTFEACRGDFVAFCEGDDFWHDFSKLQTQVAFLVEQPTYGMVHCDYDSYYVIKRKLRRREIGCLSGLRDDQAYLELLLSRRKIMTLTVCARRKLLERAWKGNPECTDESWPMGDTQLWLELCRLTKVKYFPQSMATRNILPNSASSATDAVCQFQFTEKAGQLILYYLNKYEIPFEHHSGIRKRIGRRMIEAAYVAHDRDKASFWLDRTQKTAGSVPIEAWLYFLGTRGLYISVAVRPVIWLFSTCCKVTSRLVRVYRDGLLRAK